MDRKLRLPPRRLPAGRGRASMAHARSPARRSAERSHQKITLGEMRASGVRGLLIYCSDYKCSHSQAISGDRWPDQVRLSDLEPLFICQACGRRGADVRSNFDWEQETRRYDGTTNTGHGACDTASAVVSPCINR
jgi:hypothetical protein